MGWEEEDEDERFTRLLAEVGEDDEDDDEEGDEEEGEGDGATRLRLAGRDDEDDDEADDDEEDDEGDGPARWRLVEGDDEDDDEEDDDEEEEDEEEAARLPPAAADLDLAEVACNTATRTAGLTLVRLFLVVDGGLFFLPSWPLFPPWMTAKQVASAAPGSRRSFKMSGHLPVGKPSQQDHGMTAARYASRTCAISLAVSQGTHLIGRVTGPTP